MPLTDDTGLSEQARRKRDAWAQRNHVDTYVQEMGRYAVRRDREIIQAMLGHGPGRLLDMPCGTGRYLELEKDLGYDVVASDYSPTMLSVATRFPGVQFVRADVFAPPFEPASFDVILISRLLFHYAETERILAALLPCLKPGGRMIFDVLNTFSMRWLASKVLGCVRRDPAKRLYFETFGSMRRRLDRLGLRVLDRRSAYIMPTRLYRYLPSWACGVLHAMEKLVPPAMRVLSSYNVTRAESGRPDHA